MNSMWLGLLDLATFGYSGSPFSPGTHNIIQYHEDLVIEGIVCPQCAMGAIIGQHYVS